MSNEQGSMFNEQVGEIQYTTLFHNSEGADWLETGLTRPMNPRNYIRIVF